MTTNIAPASTDPRTRWRSEVGLDCPAPPAANPRRIRYNGGAELSWQVGDEDARAAR